jgi:hypothetical protein
MSRRVAIFVDKILRGTERSGFKRIRRSNSHARTTRGQFLRAAVGFAGVLSCDTAVSRAAFIGR